MDLMFKRGLEEASKFIPRANQLVIDLESNSFANEPKEETPLFAVKEEKVEKPIFSPDEGPMDWEKNNQGDSDSEQGSSNKKPAIYGDERDEMPELFDKVLLWPGLKSTTEWCYGTRMRQDSTPQSNDQSNVSAGGKARAIKPVRKKEIIDLGSLLILCAQAVSRNDFRTANELLEQIRQHSSPTGNGSQRLAHYFATGLEARLVGSSAGLPNLYMNLASKRTTVADKLNAYKTHHSCCPFEKLSIFFAAKMIFHAAEKSKTLHIIDFGILYGFQWPILIQHLSMREGGPPKVRITGIELPERGFRPMERIEDSGRRLASYCERFHVPFDYNPIAAQNWESIQIEDLKIRTDEVLAVNCMGRFKNLLDETVELDCPRNAVLDLIRKIKPNIFVHSIINGSYNAPFFFTRFRDALFHFSSMFDMFDSTLPREDEGRMILENEMYGREAINVVAYEGVERVERPETYKQWQVRNTRAGFKQLPLDQETMEKLRGKLKSYNKDFVLDEDNNWMLQGWKGRIIYASSCWVPA
ncbi:scarecrow-like protein 14 isoform X2 [Mercurialis annua]|uniref:scarecrow-like protein 14 isoform X2 n=1 Tax=Mercurialis annua TaxID=3986 RepID=UPI00215F41EC|nr:scarecrow-like protein 14 isoform X2 [Mercurialis annua]